MKPGRKKPSRLGNRSWHLSMTGEFELMGEAEDLLAVGLDVLQQILLLPAKTTAAPG
jgi:hypothetical protein